MDHGLMGAVGYIHRVFHSGNNYYNGPETRLNLGLLISEEDSNSWSHRVVMSMKSNSASYALFASILSGAVWVEWHARGESYVLLSQRSQNPAGQSSHILVSYTSELVAEVWVYAVEACWRNLITFEKMEQDSWRPCQVIRMVGLQNWGCRVLRVSSAWIMVDWKKKSKLLRILGLAENEGRGR